MYCFIYLRFSFLVVDELLAKVLRRHKTCLLADNNLCRKLENLFLPSACLADTFAPVQVILIIYLKNIYASL